MRKAFGLGLVVGLLATALAQDVPPLQGWSQQKQDERTVLIPSGLRAGEVYRLTYWPAQPLNGGGIRSWFMAQLERDLSQLGRALSEPRIEKANDIWTGVTVASTASGNLAVMYFGLELEGDTAQLVRVVASPDQALIGRYNPEAIRYVLALSKSKPQATQPKPPTSAQANPPASPPTTNASRDRVSTPLQPSFLTAPGKGIQPAQLEATVIAAEGLKTDALTLTVRYEYGYYVLLKDGSAYGRVPAQPLEDFDVAASRQAEPQTWGRWQIQGKNLVIVWGNNPPKTYDTWFRMIPLTTQDRLEGFYRDSRVVSTTTVTSQSLTAAWSLFNFSKNGRFSQQAGGGSTITNETPSDRSGVTVRTRQDLEGTYRLTPGVLELRFDNGQVVRRSLYAIANDRKTLIIGGSAYILGK